MSESRSHIVVVDDEESDITFIRKAFERGAGNHEVVAFGTAAPFLEYLDQCQADENCPDLVLLDLSLPAVSGLEVLRTVRSGASCPLVPIIVLTSSSYRREVADAYAAGANAFVTKPARLAQLDQFVEQIEKFWLDTVRLPYS